MGLQFTASPPSFARVLECLGPPDSYGAWYLGTPAGDVVLEFRVFYENEGISALSHQFGQPSQPPPLNGTTLAQDLYYVVPTAPRETVAGLAYGISDERRAKIKPWPGSWDKIEIDIEPTAR